MLQWYSLLAPKSASLSPALLHRAAQWFLNSGIQSPDGGVARYYLADAERNAPVSNEITGYAVSLLAWAFEQTGEQSYLDAALKAGRYLTRVAWDEGAATFPFEPVAAGQGGLAYFFDCGIIVRGLLALWRASGDGEFLERAKDAAVAMAFDFFAHQAAHPILRLPEKEPLDYEPRWSRSPGCYQLKSAMCWRDVAEATGQPELAAAYERMLVYSLDTYAAFLPGEADAARVMDRLHAYSYFLEALLPVASRAECARALTAGIGRAAGLLREIEPVFARSDVYAQILRVRLLAHSQNVVALDEVAARFEAERAAEFACAETGVRHAGGFWFGRKAGQFLPFVNPVSTAFCAQALVWWQRFQNGEPVGSIAELI